MTIKLYNNTSEVNKINKILTNETSLTGVLKEGCSIENPIITFDMTGYQSTYMGKNYAYISEFGRYYFITDINPLYNNLVEISMRVDVLKSFASTILTTQMLIERSESLYSPYVTDSQRPAYNFPMVLTKAFSGSLNTPHFYLTVANYTEGS